MSRKAIAIATAAVAFLASASLAVISCSESTDGATPPTTGPTAADAAPDGGQAPSDAAARPDTQTVTASDAILNEISASGEWIEVVSTGSSAVDLSGFRVADMAKDGGPKLSESVIFPPGTVLSPKSYLLVQGGGLDGGGKPCPDGGQSYCFNAEFGISNKNGDEIYLLDVAGTVVGNAAYPPAAVDAGESWGRLPSGDPAGTFQKTLATPGATNQ